MSEQRIAIPCPHCTHSLKVRVEYVGRKVRCKSCQGDFVIPETTDRVCGECGETFAAPTTRLAESPSCPLCEVARRPGRGRPPFAQKRGGFLGATREIETGHSAQPAPPSAPGPASPEPPETSVDAAQPDALAAELTATQTLLNEARAESVRLRAKRDQARASVAEAESALAATRALLERSQATERQVRDELAACEEARTTAEDSHAAMVRELEDLLVKHAHLQEELKTERAALDGLRSALDQTRAELEGDRSRVLEAENVRMALEARLEELTAAHDQTRADLEREGAQRVEAETAHREARAALEAARAAAAELNADLERERWALEQERAERTEERRLAELDRAELRLTLEAARLDRDKSPPAPALDEALGRIVELEQRVRNHQEVNEELRSHLFGLGIMPSEGF